MENETNETPVEYEVIVQCDNCGKDNQLKIPFGVGVSAYLREVKVDCKNCGVALDY